MIVINGKEFNKPIYCKTAWIFLQWASETDDRIKASKLFDMALKREEQYPSRFKKPMRDGSIVSIPHNHNMRKPPNHTPPSQKRKLDKLI